MNKSKYFAICLLSSLLVACQSNPSTIDSHKTSSQSETNAQSEQTTQVDSTQSEISSSEASFSSASNASLVEEKHEYTVLEAIEQGKQLTALSSPITVVGYLPQAANVDEEGNYFAVILNSPDSNTPKDRIRLEGSTDFGGCKARITGNFFYNDNGEPCLDIIEAEQVLEP